MDYLHNLTIQAHDEMHRFVTCSIIVEKCSYRLSTTLSIAGRFVNDNRQIAMWNVLQCIGKHPGARCDKHVLCICVFTSHYDTFPFAVIFATVVAVSASMFFVVTCVAVNWCTALLTIGMRKVSNNCQSTTFP